MAEGLSVLFVDDDQAILDAARRLLHKSPHKILTASSARSGLDILQDKQVDVVFSDQSMAEMDGIEFLSTVRQRWPEIIRIMVTGDGSTAVARDALERVAVFRFLNKPWDGTEVWKLLDQAAVEKDLRHRSIDPEPKPQSTFTLKMIDQLKSKLIEEGLVSQKELAHAQLVAGSSADGLGNLLVRMNMVDEEPLLDFISKHLDIPRAKLDDEEIDPAVMRSIPRELAERYRMLPLRRRRNRIVVALVDPLDLIACADIRAFLDGEIEPLICSEAELLLALDQHLGPREAEAGDATALSIESQTSVDEDRVEPLEDGNALDPAEDRALISLVDSIIARAVSEGASDIHLNPEKDRLRLRYRVDGVLSERKSLPKDLCPPMVSRLKIMSGLDISLHWIPQDGRIRISADGRDVELRISTYPTVDGESVVLRVLDKSQSLVETNQLGFSQRDCKCFDRIIRKSDGMFLVTGPTGSGKTTTLYSGIAALDALSKNIITIEQPVEYELRNINQGQIQPKRGFGFADALRSILRHDPDVILVGEIRDPETAQTAFRAAMTGHLVLSTLHTKSAVGAITRLTDLGSEPFIIASSLVGVLSQRLVRKICESCREDYRPSHDLLDEMGVEKDPSARFSRGRGCEECDDTGYRGRVGLFELLVIDPGIRDLIAGRRPEVEILRAGIKGGMKLLLQDGIDKARAGITTLEEVFRVV